MTRAPTHGDPLTVAYFREAKDPVELLEFLADPATFVAKHPACPDCSGSGSIVRETPGLPAAQSSAGFAATAKLERVACRCQTEEEQ